MSGTCGESGSGKQRQRYSLARIAIAAPGKGEEQRRYSRGVHRELDLQVQVEDDVGRGAVRGRVRIKDGSS